ncbi:MAG: aminopeptidase P family protein [Rhodoferax sp.]|nr:aminopeptidase P family protein [Rhodoferax sp.]
MDKPPENPINPTNPVIARLARIRTALQDHQAQAVLVPSSDPHLSEYLPGRWQTRQWASGFTGSAGTLVVTQNCAVLFTDSRYWTQAHTQLQGSGIVLEKVTASATSPHNDWLARNLPSGSCVLVDGQVLGLSAEKTLRVALTAANITLRTDVDLFNTVWSARPALPQAAVLEHPQPFATQTRAEKLAQVRAAMAQDGCTAHFISAVDDIAWMLNLRGSDVPYNPVFLAHALLSAESVMLFISPGKISTDLAARLSEDGITVHDYAAAPQALAAIAAGSRILIDPRRVTFGLRQNLQADVVTVEATNPCTLLKSRKNGAQADCIRQAMEEDGAAMCAFYAWFEQALATQTVTELDVAERLNAARARRKDFMGLSFPVIAGFNANGALPHYCATESAYATIAGNGLLLIDSGGHYLGGTTDITRTWAIGETSDAQRRDYTAVLKGMLALSRTRFPLGTLSPMLDAIARAPLWAQGLDYGHGTGHGVGYYLNVHEGPQSFSQATPEKHHAMQAGMLTSIEPGVYREGQWGVRIENLVLTVSAPTRERDAFGPMLQFETVTLCPIDLRCIERSMLDAQEIAWLNAYHAQVRERLRPLLNGAALDWLLRRTAAI